MKKNLDVNELLQLETKVKSILDKLNLSSSIPVREALRDKTKDSFSEIVTSKTNRKFFLKIKLLNTSVESAKFVKLFHIHTQIDKTENPLKSRVAKLVDSNIDEVDSYLLFEYLQGESMGSRTIHDLIKLDNNDISAIKKINRAMINLDITLIKKYLPLADFDHYLYLIYQDAGFDRENLSTYFTDIQINQIISFKKNTELKEIADRSKKVFEHGDFQPPNFYKTKENLMLVDFDSSLLASPLYDIAYLYNHSYRKPQFQKELLTDTVADNLLTTENKYFFTFIRFCLTFVWIKVFINKKAWYLSSKITDFIDREKIFQMRLADVKKYLSILE